MSLEELAGILRQALLALGLLFVIVDLRVGWQLFTWLRRRHRAVIVWPIPKPPYYAINLAIGVMLGVLLCLNGWLAFRHIALHPAASLFGVGMMFLYYGYLLPLSTRIRRGIYEDGIWTDSGFMPWPDIAGLTWKEDASTLVMASRQKALARRLEVPGPHLGEVRHLLREKIGSHAIVFDEGPGLHLGTRDTRESV
jgi:hypothetical protein